MHHKDGYGVSYNVKLKPTLSWITIIKKKKTDKGKERGGKITLKSIHGCLCFDFWYTFHSLGLAVFLYVYKCSKNSFFFDCLLSNHSQNYLKKRFLINWVVYNKVSFPMIAQNSQPGSRKFSIEEHEWNIGLGYIRVQAYK